MKYGPVLTYRDIEEAKKLIGKIVIATDLLNKIENYPKQCLTSFLLDEVSIGVDSPFIVTSCDSKTKDCFQFIREVIEEKPQYRPFTTKELAGQVGKVVRYKNTDTRVLATIFENGKLSVARDSHAYTGEEFLERFEFADGRPCGVEASRINMRNHLI